jgi:hypothetical protein
VPCHQSRRRLVACRRRGANAARCTSPRRGRAASNAKSSRHWPRASFAAAHVRCRTPSRRLCIRCRWPAPTGSSCDANRPALPRGQQHPGPRADYTRGAHHPCPHRSQPPVVCAASRHRKTVSISPRRSAPRLTVVAPTDDGGRPSLRANPDSPAADGARNAVLQVGVVAAPAVLRATSSPSPSPLLCAARRCSPSNIYCTSSHRALPWPTLAADARRGSRQERNSGTSTHTCRARDRSRAQRLQPLAERAGWTCASKPRVEHEPQDPSAKLQSRNL